MSVSFLRRLKRKMNRCATVHYVGFPPCCWIFYDFWHVAKCDILYGIQLFNLLLPYREEWNCTYVYFRLHLKNFFRNKDPVKTLFPDLEFPDFDFPEFLLLRCRRRSTCCCTLRWAGRRPPSRTCRSSWTPTAPSSPSGRATSTSRATGWWQKCTFRDALSWETGIFWWFLELNDKWIMGQLCRRES